MSATKRVVVLSDIQAPLHSVDAVRAVTRFIADYQPDEVLCVGDENDNAEVSRWQRGTRAEFAGTLQKSLDITFEVMRGFREAAGTVPFTVQRSNHGDRIGAYVRKYAPALDGLNVLDYNNLLRYDELGITVSHKPTNLGNGVYMVHGDEAGLNQTAGGTALGIARKLGASIVSGHCFDDKTELLTPQGWVRHEDMTDTTIALTMNTETGAGEWQAVEGVYRYDHYKELVHVTGFGLDLAVTEDHGLVTQSRVTGDYLLPKASEVFGKEVMIPLSVTHDEESLPLRDCEIRFLAWVMAEAHVDGSGCVRIAQSEAGTAALESVLNDCGYEYSKALRYKGGEVGHGVWRNQDAYRYGMRDGAESWRPLVSKYLEPKTKNPNRNLAGMDSRQAGIFLEAYALADGHRATVNAFQLNTKDVEKVDFFQELAVRSARRSSISRRKNGGHYTVSINDRPTVRAQKGAWERKPYSGVVWCVSVPNGTLVVRRNGKTAVTQNTHKLGLQHQHASVNGRVTRNLWGMEVGHLMDLRKASYLKAGSANWQLGFGLLNVSGNTTIPTPVPIINRKFVVDGNWYTL